MHSPVSSLGPVVCVHKPLHDRVLDGRPLERLESKPTLSGIALEELVYLDLVLEVVSHLGKGIYPVIWRGDDHFLLLLLRHGGFGRLGLRLRLLVHALLGGLQDLAGPVYGVWVTATLEECVAILCRAERFLRRLGNPHAPLSVWNAELRGADHHQQGRGLQHRRGGGTVPIVNVFVGHACLLGPLDRQGRLLFESVDLGHCQQGGCLSDRVVRVHEQLHCVLSRHQRLHEPLRGDGLRRGGIHVGVGLACLLESCAGNQELLLRLPMLVPLLPATSSCCLGFPQDVLDLLIGKANAGNRL
mmetsp:Transcript_55258/g.161253  ORF Transcript_55258/g.161253 Transcript_55258/m.161253 type:complete len:301 (+) Transcript_55258:169-1071(+)